MRKHILMVCVSLAAAISLNGCFNDEIKTGSFKDLCEMSGGGYDNYDMKCICGKDKCVYGTVCTQTGDITHCAHALAGEPCEGRAKQCLNGVLYTCQEDVWSEGEKCLSGYCNEEGDGCLRICVPGEIKCLEGTILRCTNGSWENFKECGEYSCLIDEEGASSRCGECKDGSTKCENGAIFNCSSGQWVESSKCSEGKSCKLNEDGVTSTQCGECFDGDYSCNAGNVKICRGGRWADFQSCDSTSCDSSDRLCGECHDNERICINNVEKSYMMICSSGTWVAKDDNICNGSSCTDNKDCGECRDGNKKCEDGKSYSCSNGQWDDGVECQDGNSCKYNESLGSLCGECKDGSTKCENGKSYSCSNGQWDDGVECQGENSCKYDESLGNICGECKNGEFLCNDNNMKLCQTGIWTEYQKCTTTCDADGEMCEGCIENESICINTSDATIFRICQNSEWSDSKPCENGVSCQDNRQCGVCKNGDTKCENDRFSVCDNGKWSEPVECTNNASCMNEKQCGECKNNDTECLDGKVLGTCINGTWNENICDTFCEDSQCVPSNCTESSDKPRCIDNNNKGELQKCINNVWQYSLCEADPGKSCKRNPDDLEGYMICGECLNGETTFENVFDSETNKKKCQKTECIEGVNVTSSPHGNSCKCNDSVCYDYGDCIDDNVYYKTNPEKYCVESICKNGILNTKTIHDVSCTGSNGTDGVGVCKNGDKRYKQTEERICQTSTCENGEWLDYVSDSQGRSCTVNGSEFDGVGECKNNAKRYLQNDDKICQTSTCENGKWGLYINDPQKRSCKISGSDITGVGDCWNDWYDYSNPAYAHNINSGCTIDPTAKKCIDAKWQNISQPVNCNSKCEIDGSYIRCEK